MKSITFTPEMMKAILAGHKRVTRRVIVPQPTTAVFQPEIGWQIDYGFPRGQQTPAPYGREGDILALKSTWAVLPEFDSVKPTELDPKDIIPHFWYAGLRQKPPEVGKSRPGRFLPKTLWTLMPQIRITYPTRMERLQEITYLDVLYEGIEEPDCIQQGFQIFIGLWNNINAKRGYGWEQNPFVTVTYFELYRMGV